MKELMALANAKLASSGLTGSHAKMLHMEVMDGVHAAALGAQPVGSLRIPYFDALGRTTKFYRLRYLEPLVGFAALSAKPQRYHQPKGTLNEVYLPPLLAKPWVKILEDPKETIHITEGELKAASACAVGLPTVGLGGVDVWRSAKRGIDMLPALSDAKWEGRNVVIVYDSDAAQNLNVCRAQRQLARALLALGARPSIASLPATKNGEKQGLDDYIVNNGRQALEDIISSADPFEESQALWELNEEIAYIRDPGLVVQRPTKLRMSPNSFVTHAYANRHYYDQKITKTGISLVKKPLAPRWLEWERRFELARITYLPGQLPITEADEWNTWEGWGVEPVKGDVAQWHWLMDFVFKGKKKEKEWFQRWLAYPLQHPGTKMFSSAVVWGTVHGTGKTLVGHSMKEIYGKNFEEIKDRSLKSGFNEWAQNKQFVLGDEVTGNDSRAEADAIKGMITQAELRINAKYVPSFSVPDCINYFFTSNHPDAFFLEDTDRRFFVHELVGPPASQPLYRAYDAWIHGGGAAALFWYLLHLPLGDFDPKAAAMNTSSKQTMILDAKSDVAAWVLRLREDPQTALKPFGERIAKNCDLFTNEQLLYAYDPERATRVAANGMGRELTRAGIRKVNGGQPVSLGKSLDRLYAVRNADQWDGAGSKVCSEHWAQFFGSKAGKL